jgi:hypothetical protein
MAGGDHGKGAFIFGAKIAVVLCVKKDSNEIDWEAYWEAYFEVEISVAEIICGKDSAEIIDLAIKDELTTGLKTTWTMMMKEHQRYRALTLRLVESSEQLFLFKRNYTS